MKRVLNVGGNDRGIALPPMFEAWEQVWLDIDPAVKPDVVCDARELATLPAHSYDAIYCSHNLEHYHRHEVPRVLEGFRHVLRPEGFAYIRVPNIAEVLQIAVERDLDIDDVLYTSTAGPITVHDVIFGFGAEIRASGNDFFAHKTAFTPKALTKVLQDAGFKHVFWGAAGIDLAGFGFVIEPDAATKTLLNLG